MSAVTEAGFVVVRIYFVLENLLINLMCCCSLVACGGPLDGGGGADTRLRRYAGHVYTTMDISSDTVDDGDNDENDAGNFVGT